jgi:hypothetical protein
MAYATAQARQELLDTVAEAADALGEALTALGEAYEQLDEHSADRLEAELFQPVQAAYGRARRTHADFAARHGLPARTFAPPAPGAAHPLREWLDRAVTAVERADEILVELQDSMRPVEVGDAELRAGLAEVRRHLGEALERAPGFLRVLGR